MKDCNKFTGMAEPKVENLWSNPFVFSSTIKYLKYKKEGFATCAAQIASLSVCIEQYISTGSKPVLSRVACSVHATYR